MALPINSSVKGENPYAKYCPVCQKFIIPSNILDVKSGAHDGFIYVHDDINHDDADLAALEAGVQ